MFLDLLRGYYMVFQVCIYWKNAIAVELSIINTPCHIISLMPPESDKAHCLEKHNVNAVIYLIYLCVCVFVCEHVCVFVYVCICLHISEYNRPL